MDIAPIDSQRLGIEMENGRDECVPGAFYACVPLRRVGRDWRPCGSGGGDF